MGLLYALDLGGSIPQPVVHDFPEASSWCCVLLCHITPAVSVVHASGELAKRVRYLLPACARTSIDRLLTLTLQCHLNGMDITAPHPGAEMQGEEEGAGTGAEAGARAETGARAGAKAEAGAGVDSRGGGLKRGQGQGLGDSQVPAMSASLQQLLRQGGTVGEGLFPSAARFNHSCEPSVGLYFDGWGCLVAKAAKPCRCVR